MAKDSGFTKEEKAAMKERAKELKAAKSREEAEQDVLEKIAEMSGTEKKIAQRLHEIVKANAPSLYAKTWYGMPAYANADGKSVIFFQPAAKFQARYSTLGFQDTANLDEGSIWPTSFAVTELTPDVEARMIKLVKQAVS